MPPAYQVSVEVTHTTTISC